MTIFILVVFVLIIVFSFIVKILNTSSFRIMLITHKIRQEEKERNRELEELKKRTLEQIKEPDEFLELILKIRRGERVKIPLAAFSYIYRNLEDFSVFDEDGNINIVNQKQYLEFKEKAKQLLRNSKEEDIDIEKVLKRREDKILKSPIEIQEHEDGTFVKKDYVENTIEISKPDGEKILIDMDTQKVIHEKIIEVKDDKNNKSKEEIGREKQEEKKISKELEQRITILEEKQKNNSEEIDEDFSDIEVDEIIELSKGKDTEHLKKQELLTKKFPKSKKSKTEKISKENTAQEENKTEKSKLNNNFKKKPGKKVEEKKIRLKFDKDYDTFTAQITHNNCSDIMCYILDYIHPLHNICILYIPNMHSLVFCVHIFLYRLSRLVEDENERETFLKEIIKDNRINDDFLTILIKRINFVTSMKYGFKILMQENVAGNITNYKNFLVGSEDENDKNIYKADYIYMFMNNKFAEKEIENQDFFEKIKNNKYKILIKAKDDAIVNEITFEDFRELQEER